MFTLREFYGKRLQRLFSKYAPEKINTIENLLELHQGKESELMVTLAIVYGPEPPAEPVALSTATANPHVGKSEAFSDCSTIVPPRRPLYNETSFVLTQCRETPVLHPYAISKNPSKFCPLRAWYRRRLQRIFEVYDPSRLSSLDELLTEHERWESRLIFQLVSRYGPEPSAKASTITDGPFHSQSAGLTSVRSLRIAPNSHSVQQVSTARQTTRHWTTTHYYTPQAQRVTPDSIYTTPNAALSYGTEGRSARGRSVTSRVPCGADKTDTCYFSPTGAFLPESKDSECIHSDVSTTDSCDDAMTAPPQRARSAPQNAVKVEATPDEPSSVRRTALHGRASQYCWFTQSKDVAGPNKVMSRVHSIARSSDAGETSCSSLRLPSVARSETADGPTRSRIRVLSIARDIDDAEFCARFDAESLLTRHMNF